MNDKKNDKLSPFILKINLNKFFSKYNSIETIISSSIRIYIFNVGPYWLH